MSNLVSNVKVYGLIESVLASGYPMMDSPLSAEEFDQLVTAIKSGEAPHKHPRLLKACKLAKCRTGTGHDNFLNGVIVQFDLAFTNKAWVEAERYHFLDFVSSYSTMHKLGEMDLTGSYNEYVDPRIVKIMMEKQEHYNKNPNALNYLKLLYSNPAGFILPARLTTNYRQLKTIYYQRRSHRLPEWREFCTWIESLPLAQEFICNMEK